MANELIYSSDTTSNYAFQREGDTEGTSYLQFGRQTFIGTDYTWNGAIRFTGVAIPQGYTVNSATLYLYHAGTSNSSDVYLKAYGIDEDNTSSFGNPFGRSKTDASNTHNQTVANGGYFGIAVANIVNEIVGRGSWSSGNAMGFILEDNGSAAEQYIYDGASGANTFLAIRLDTEPNFKPSPKSVASPTFPAADDCGIRVSAPTKDVLTVTDSDIWFTTRKRTFGVFEEGEVEIPSSPHTITHNLGYQPAALAYANYSGKKYRFPDFVNLSSGGIIYTNKTQAKIITDADKVYYYIFIDPIELV